MQSRLQQQDVELPLSYITLSILSLWVYKWLRYRKLTLNYILLRNRSTELNKPTKAISVFSWKSVHLASVTGQQINHKMLTITLLR